MVKSMFAAIAGLKTHQSRLDVISNNIANVNTWGYKSRSANFADTMYQNVISGAAGNMRGSGGMNSSQLGYGVGIGSISTNFTGGSRNPTGDGFHCMIDGPSFFIVGGMSNGINPDDLTNGGISLSRVGIFGPDNNGYLVDDQGNYVYGYKPEYYTQADADANPNADPPIVPGEFKGFDTTSLGPIQMMVPDLLPGVNPGDPPIPQFDANGEVIMKRADVESYKIGTDGSLVGVDGESKTWNLGQIAVASVENVNGLEQRQGYLYGIGPNAGSVTTEQPGSDAIGKIYSGYLEMSNVDLATEIASMITTQRGYQANSKIVTVTDEMLEQLVNMKR